MRLFLLLFPFLVVMPVLALRPEGHALVQSLSATAPPEPGFVSLSGTVADFAPRWAEDGAGYLVLKKVWVKGESGELPQVEVDVVGRSHERTTVIKMELRYINDLICHTVQVKGIRQPSGRVIARSIVEY